MFRRSPELFAVLMPRLRELEMLLLCAYAQVYSLDVRPEGFDER